MQWEPFVLEDSGLDADGDEIEVWRSGNWWHYKNLTREYGEFLYAPQGNFAALQEFLNLTESEYLT